VVNTTLPPQFGKTRPSRRRQRWLHAGSTADLDVIRTTLDRLEGAVRAGQSGRAEQARIEAYAVFEFGPEQRLRGLAPGLFARVEGFFWYGSDGHPGLAQLVERKASPDDVRDTRVALDAALAEAEAAVGSGLTSTAASAIRCSSGSQPPSSRAPRPGPSHRPCSARSPATASGSKRSSRSSRSRCCC
jgi:hypothetical protein